MSHTTPMPPTVIDTPEIPAETLINDHGGPRRVSIADDITKLIVARRIELDTMATGARAVYGVNTGFGNLCQQRINAGDLARLQENLIISHAVGVGPAAPDAIVRRMLWFKLHALSRGFSGISPAVFELLAALLDHDILPVVPTRGSVGASGDLAPLAHLALPLLGRGNVRVNGHEQSAESALKSAGLNPVALGAKDGLALINGTQYMSACGAELIHRATRLATLADAIAAMSIDALRGSDSPFDARLHNVRPHPGAQAVAENMRTLMHDSQIRESHRDCDKVQDPYSLRCIPAVHGACRDALRHAIEVFTREINSVTDNPVIFGGDSISGGNFHGEPVAMVLDYLAIALTEWASISERRCYLLLDSVDGLPPVLMAQSGLNSGFMITQYVAAALVNECKTLAHPASVDTIPTSAGQEDHVSMGATSANKALAIMDNVETVLAIEAFCAAQALDFRAPFKPGVGAAALHQAIRRTVAHADADREFRIDMDAVTGMLKNGDLSIALRSACPNLH